MREHHIALACRGITKRFGEKRVLHDVSLEIASGQIVALVGPSGCGKSTLLSAILGTLRPSAGTIRVRHDDVMRGVEGPNRDCGIVYQNYALYPFLTARENVALGPMLDATSIPFRLLHPFRWRRMRRNHLAQAEALLRKVRIDEQHAYPSELSGGMRQRVAIAQALIMRPTIMLLDEPFGALDEATREELQMMLLELYEENVRAIARGEHPPHTILIVTHELTEALYVADRVIGLSQHWDWRAAGFDACPGATIVYDKVAPVFKPGAVKHYEDFVEQREAIRRIVFEPDAPTDPRTHVLFWDQVRSGEGTGIQTQTGDPR